ncbi:MAG TPA: MarR family transcriptional regulator [Aggregatilineales bacterium]|nr:MarR family transcriptional regulator [Aggregatilineales bacterium]
MQKVSEYVGYLLVQVTKAHRKVAETGLHDFGLYVGQELILFRLEEQDGMTQSDLADVLCVEAPTVTKGLQRMEAVGMIERRQDPSDARVSRVYLTPKSRQLIEPLRELWAEVEQKTIKGLSEPEVMLLQRLLLQILENLSDDKV